MTTLREKVSMQLSQHLQRWGRSVVEQCGWSLGGVTAVQVSYLQELGSVAGEKGEAGLIGRCQDLRKADVGQRQEAIEQS